MDPKLQELLDKQAITELLNRYGSALDDHDWERLRSCFTPDAVADYDPNAPNFEGYEAIEGLCRSMLGPLDASQHLIGNHEIEVEGDTARSRCYFRAQHVLSGCEGGQFLEVAGYYRDELARGPNGWRIHRRQMVVTWREGNARVLQPQQN